VKELHLSSVTIETQVGKGPGSTGVPNKCLPCKSWCSYWVPAKFVRNFERPCIRLCAFLCHYFDHLICMTFLSRYFILNYPVAQAVISWIIAWIILGDLWWTKWHWVKFLSEDFNFLLSISSPPWWNRNAWGRSIKGPDSYPLTQLESKFDTMKNIDPYGPT
jgi:hypothetical protein